MTYVNSYDDIPAVVEAVNTADRLCIICGSRKYVWAVKAALQSCYKGSIHINEIRACTLEVTKA